MDLNKILESILFTASRPIKAKELAKILEMEEAQVKQILEDLVEAKKDAAIVLLGSQEGYQLATNSKYSTQVKNFLNAELREKLTDATVEVLAIIAYRQPISKAEIEAIRGVNSQYSIRHLLMRGMIEKVVNPQDARSVMYQTTTEFLMHMGLSSSKELPEFEKLVEQIKLPETPALSQDSQTDFSIDSKKPEPYDSSISSVEPAQPVENNEPVINAPAEAITESVEMEMTTEKNLQPEAKEDEQNEDMDEDDDDDEDEE